MQFRNSKHLITAGFLVMFALLIAITVIGIVHMAAINQRLDRIISQHDTEIDLLHSMRNIVRERSMSMYQMYIMDDPFARNDEFLRFNGMVDEFLRLRRQFEEVSPCAKGSGPVTAEPHCDQEREHYRQVLALIRQSQPLQAGRIACVSRSPRRRPSPTGRVRRRWWPRSAAGVTVSHSMTSAAACPRSVI